MNQTVQKFRQSKDDKKILSLNSVVVNFSIGCIAILAIYTEAGDLLIKIIVEFVAVRF